MVSTNGGCEVALTSRTWVHLWNVVSYYTINGFLEVESVVCQAYVRLTTLYISEVMCVGESEMGILQTTWRSVMRAMCQSLLNSRK